MADLTPPGLTVWLIAALALVPLLFACLYGCLRGTVLARIASLELATNVAVVMLLLLAQGLGRSTFYDMALALAILSFPGGLAFVVTHERWL